MEESTYIHVPKTAGTSLLKAMGKERGSHVLFKNVFLTQRPVITCVRNPYDRAVSIFYYLKGVVAGSNIGGNPTGHFTDGYESASDFWAGDSYDFFYRRSVVRGLVAVPFLVPQIRFIEGDDKGIIDPRIQYVLRYENLEEQWEEMISLFGFDALEHVNASSLRGGEDWQESLSSEAKAKIAELYSEDFDVLGYDR